MPSRSYLVLRDCHEEARELGVSCLVMLLPVHTIDVNCSLKYVKSAKAATDVPTTVSEGADVRLPKC